MKITKAELKNILHLGWTARREKLAQRKKNNNQACRDWQQYAPPPPKSGKQST